MELTTSDLNLLNIFRLHQLSDLLNCNVFIITVPTPLDESKQPDLSPLKSASEMIGESYQRKIL